MAWLVLVGLVLAAVAAGALAARALQREVEPTVRAFSEFRAALEPAVADLGVQAGETRRRLSALSERGDASSRR